MLDCGHMYMKALHLRTLVALGLVISNLTLGLQSGFGANAGFSAQNLRCEYRENPQTPNGSAKNPVDAVDVARPRLSWVM